MSEKSSSKKSGGVHTGTVGLVFTIIACVGIAITPGGLYSALLGGALGFTGLVICIVGIARGSGRVAGVFGIFVFILCCLMMFVGLLDLSARERNHSG
jgi:hypothetical protein